MRPPLALVAAACLAAACVHQEKAPPAETAIQVHGRIITEEADQFGLSLTDSPIFGHHATTLMAGKCAFSSCLEDGWTSPTPEGDAVTRCGFGDCARNGWTTEHPDGTRSQTRCTFGNCFKDGWVTTHEDGNALEVRCDFGDCLRNGWTATSSSGETARTRCSLGDCAGAGWTTTGGAKTVECTCRFRNCRKNGAECREQ
jgi:hypothetical protein